jgi:hypothetical protein
MELSTFREAVSCAATQEIPAYYVTRMLITAFKELSTIPHPEPDQSSPNYPILSLQNSF